MIKRSSEDKLKKTMLKLLANLRLLSSKLLMKKQNDASKWKSLLNSMKNRCNAKEIRQNDAVNNLIVKDYRKLRTQLTGSLTT